MDGYTDAQSMQAPSKEACRPAPGWPPEPHSPGWLCQLIVIFATSWGFHGEH